MVELSVDGKRKLKSWGSSTDGKAYFIQDISAIGATKEILRSGDFRVGFFDALGHFYVAKFKPAGIDRAMVAKYCGEKFLKP